MDLFGERLKGLRESKNMTQNELGKTLHLSQSIIAHYEANRKQPGRQTIIRIAQFFNVSTDYLYGLSDDPTPPQAPTKEPTPEEQVLSAAQIGDALKIAFNLYSSEKIDEVTLYRLAKLAKDKFGLPSVETEEAARSEKNIPGSGILGDDNDENNND